MNRTVKSIFEYALRGLKAYKQNEIINNYIYLLYYDLYMLCVTC